jgi:methylated-DNA-[protein]-cysteine S-methyltransferase
VKSTPPNSFEIFPTDLGWMAILGANETVKQLTFGHPSAAAALAALLPELVAEACSEAWCPKLVRRLQAYAQGEVDDFRDVVCDPGPLTAFRREVLRHCRQIPYGKTRTYGELAAKAGIEGAARAVGNCMAANRIPLIVPCHRVVSSSAGRFGGFSAAGGISMKKRLLKMESHGREDGFWAWGRESVAPRSQIKARRLVSKVYMDEGAVVRPQHLRNRKRAGGKA